MRMRRKELVCAIDGKMEKRKNREYIAPKNDYFECGVICKCSKEGENSQDFYKMKASRQSFKRTSSFHKCNVYKSLPWLSLLILAVFLGSVVGKLNMMNIYFQLQL